MINVLLAEDHAMVRQAMCSLLERVGDIHVVALASNGQEAVNQAVVHCPHVALMDVSMPVMDGVEATRQICTLCPQTRVVMVSAHNKPQYVESSVGAGALGYVLKDAASCDLVIAVRAAYRGTPYFSKQVAEFAKGLYTAASGDESLGEI